MSVSILDQATQPNSSPPELECRDVAMEFFNSHGVAEQVLKGLDLRVSSGEILTLLGPSGCGKSTLLRILAGLLSPTKGQVLIQGQSFQEGGRALKDQLSFVFQEPALLPWRTVWENVSLLLQLRGKQNSAEAKESIEHWLSMVGLSAKDWPKKPGQLSGGMKMRASIARAMTTRPRILLMDEPFAALDDVLRSRLNDLLLKIVDEEKCTVVFVTHNITEAVYMSDSIAIMDQGKFSERLEILFDEPRSTELRTSTNFSRYYAAASASLFRNVTADE
ncbi:ABC transporter ATP-binding protein [Pirellulaceae bacterium SH501]